MAKTSPMIQQYHNIKEKHQDAILFFRLGDFYEMFYDDAEKISKELELTLTGRDCGEGKRAPMCGIPYHSCDTYIERLIKKGYKIAICEQGEVDPNSRGIVKREVTRVVTPGTITEGSMLDETRNNYICSIFCEGDTVGLCFCDVSTGSLNATIIDDDVERNLLNELSRFTPSEILINNDSRIHRGVIDFANQKLGATVEMLSDDKFATKECLGRVEQHFDKTVQELNIEGNQHLIASLGALLSYLQTTQMTGLQNIGTLNIYKKAQFMGIDYNTKRNLELTETMIKLEKKGSLLWVLDKTRTSMGKRLIKTFIERPLLDEKAINKRLDAVQELKENMMLSDDIRTELNKVADIERLMTKVVYGSCNARNLRSLADTFSVLPEVKRLLSGSKSTLLSLLNDRLDNLESVYEMIDGAISQEPPFTVREGEIIRDGFNQEVDELRGIVSNLTEHLAKIEAKQRQETGIPNLKVRYNKVFGYYIEVTNSHKDKVPEEYVRKQTLANCERYITQELKLLESKVLGAKDKLTQMEYEIFNDVRDKTASELHSIQKTARALAYLDVLCSFAIVAREQRYVKPIVNSKDKIVIKQGRHPVVEKILRGAPFVPNDVNLDNNENRCAIITGPNMAGKSTYMRQIALIVLMTQIGSFVPAGEAAIGVVDNIFTRVGASDDLAAGQSTFMVEMSEVSEILQRATENSLIILDEIGRGTSTFDGMSIARAVIEHVVDKNKLGAKTLFSTHYHELTRLEEDLSGVKNYNVSVKKRGDDITFLRRIVRGGADDSYGIEVAKLAGLPVSVIDRSKQIIKDIEKENRQRPMHNQLGFDELVSEKVSLTDTQQKVISRLRQLEVDTLTPIEAMNTLFELKKLLD